MLTVNDLLRRAVVLCSPCKRGVPWLCCASSLLLLAFLAIMPSEFMLKTVDCAFCMTRKNFSSVGAL